MWARTKSDGKMANQATPHHSCNWPALADEALQGDEGVADQVFGVL